LQNLVGDIRAAIAPNAQTANANPAGPAGATGHHHHRHHHGGGGEATGAFDVAASNSSGSGAVPTGTQLANNQPASAAADVAEAVQADGTTAAASTLTA